MASVIDLFCCGGGAAEGYRKAGLGIIGVDIKPQPQYPFEFIQADWEQGLEKAVQLCYEREEPFIVHASPPCQAYSHAVTSRSSEWNHTKGKDEPALINAVRDKLENLKVFYVIENVVGARSHMVNPFMLCGTMFGLPIARHRLFETNFPVVVPSHPKCRGVAKRYAELVGWDYRDMSVTGKGRSKGTTERWKALLGIEHDMTQHQLAEAIPPDYTRLIGVQIKCLS